MRNDATATEGVSTVDNAGGAMGQASVVHALDEQAAGDVGTVRPGRRCRRPLRTAAGVVSRAATIAAGALAAAGAHVAHRVLTARVHSPRWRRTNHAGAPVTLLEGPSYVAGAALGAAAAGPAGVVAALGSGAFGALDDLAGDGASKGLRGHLGAAAPR